MKRLLLFLYPVLVLSEVVRHDGYKTIRITADSKGKAEFLHTLNNDSELDVWREVVGELDVMVPPHRLSELELELNNNDLTWTTIVDDVQQLMEKVELTSTPRSDYNYSDFNTLHEMQNELHQLAEDCSNHPVYPDLSCVVSQLSPSTINHHYLEVLRVRRPGDNRKIIYLDSLTHGREWLTGSSVMNIANDIVHGITQEGIDYLDTYDFYFNPIVNPDGYDYTWTTDRTWRKNMNPNDGHNCTGVDNNRNFDYDWGVSGSSDDPCNNTYRGERPASESETRAVQGEMEAHGRDIYTYVSMHTSGEMWLTPYGTKYSDGTCKLPNLYYDCQRTVSRWAAYGSQVVYGVSTWIYGDICDNVYPASGGTIDYATGEQDITFALVPELRGQDNEGNVYGYLAPASEIPYAYQEAWNGLVALLVEIELLESFGTCSP